MRKGVALWCIMCLMVLAGVAAAGEAAGGAVGKGVLKVALSGFNNDEGDARIVIVGSEEEYSKGNTGLRSAALPIKKGKAEWVLTDLPFGTYAIKVFHDQNGNGKLDKNMVGIPKEQYGFSNNARATFGPPGFEKARFSFSKTGMVIEITME